MSSVTANLTAADEATDWLQVSPGPNAKFLVRVLGTYVGEVIVEVRRVGEDVANRLTFATITADTAELNQYTLGGGWEVRALMESYTSGTAVATIYNDF